MRWGLFDQICQFSLRAAGAILFARLLGPHNLGIMAIVLLVFNFAGLLSGFGFAPALIQRRSLTVDHVKTAFTASIGVGIAITGALMLLAPTLSSFFHEPQLTKLLIAVSPIFIMQGIEAIPNAMLRRAMRLKEFVLSSTAGAFLGVGTGVALAALGFGVWSLVWYTLVESFTAMFLACVFARVCGVWKPRISFRWSALRDITRFSSYLTLGQILSFGQTNGDNLVVGRILTATSLGFYEQAYNVMLFPIQKVADVLGNISFPALAAVQHDVPRLRRGFLQSCRYVALVCFPVTVGVAVAAPVFVPVLFGNRWVPAVATFQLLAINGPRIALNRLNSYVYQTTGHTDWLMWTNAVSLAVYFPAFIIGAHFGGTVGVAWAVTIASVFLQPITMYLTGGALEMRPIGLLTNVGRIFWATVAMAVAGELVLVASRPIAPEWRLVAVIAVSAVVYLVSVELLSRGLLRQAAQDFLRRKPR
jgi:PST family polysaccharide transporter